MKTGNKVGLTGLGLFAASIPMAVWPTLIDSVGVFLSWGGIAAFLLAGILRPRWWLILPLVIVGGWLWVLTLGH